MNPCFFCGTLTLNPKFCNRSCAAKHNNKSFPKRKPQNKCKDCGVSIRTQRVRCQSCHSIRTTNGECPDCGIPIPSRSLRCQGCNSIGRNKIIADWKIDPKSGIRSGFRLKSRIRNYLLEQADHKCSQCGWNEINPVTGKSPLEIDHIDGNCENAAESNLRVLCPNCHSLTPTWKFLNSGNGNRQRHNYFGLTKEP